MATNQFDTAREKAAEISEAHWKGFQSGRHSTLDAVYDAIDTSPVPRSQRNKNRVKAHIKKTV